MSDRGFVPFDVAKVERFSLPQKYFAKKRRRTFGQARHFRTNTAKGTFSCRKELKKLE